MPNSISHSLFGPGCNGSDNACVNLSCYQWNIYIEGYDRAVEVLVDHVSRNRVDLDSLVYPIVFSARHSVELRLKHIHRDLCSRLNVKQRLSLTHDLPNLWGTIRPLIERALSVMDLEIQARDDIEWILSEFDKTDANSDAFRYPVDKSENPSLSPDLKLVNIQTFYTQFCKVRGSLDGLHIAMEIVLENE